ncbi:hypothetical protein GCM10010495_24280 [Kitasatospora herbaricolor]|uniref:hypothetical protein n=1 Tax=Kitasatospora herbaricolor TaxID=68217 RepID=UPI00174CEA7C|nr:hypothetical protein [Kitasatospora herbaricolor]MDQ0308789.1 hypothetical protein [Kitasatospora herbaricolor]GGV10192.1 hypothetical protein GCM10010495_24280 [Kitasatospora herbaricolor]
MSNPYQTPPPDPHGGYGQQQQPYGAPQYQQPQAYQQPGYGYPPQQQAYVPPQPAAQQNSYATATVVLGFVAVLFSCFYGGFIGLIGLGVGIAGLNRSATTGIGRNMSIGGIALNTLAVLISVGLVVLIVIAPQ